MNLAEDMHIHAKTNSSFGVFKFIKHPLILNQMTFHTCLYLNYQQTLNKVAFVHSKLCEEKYRSK